ncbi:uncharacterized protein RCC_11523 [Ramularia collo-cygni]|uniref:Uncharacterized protein n=1 Tax=Ramularia collo-cygni TaxID=112498 RepID=A0A2D3VNZ6_9PEZI|nr:uncharacterized protein RCC_11523 [Ramularia collo-cygni]CZT25854.1 uncharacterized protein RCC_11523 [Ramularia collo-cygni]
MNAILGPPTLYHVLFESIQFDSPEEVVQRVIYNLRGPAEQAKKARRALSYLLSTIILLGKLDLLKALSDPMLQYGVPVIGTAVKEAATLPFEKATFCLKVLFTLGWDVNQALSNTQPPVLSAALHDASLTHWLLEMGADPNATTDIDCTPLSIAVSRFDFQIVHLLLEHAHQSRNGHLVYYATQRTDPDESVTMIRLLHLYDKPIDEILYQDPKSYRLRAPFLRGTPLYYACVKDRMSVALALVELGADPDKACQRYNESVGPTPRQVAANLGWTLFERKALRFLNLLTVGQ